MSNIINKSNHPVEVKKIEIQIWKLRDEIEAAIANRISDEGHSSEKPADIEDIKEYYINILNGTPISEPDSDDGDDENDPNVDSSGNPMDDDAMAMMSALKGEDTEAEDDKKDEAAQEEPEAEDTVEDKVDDESSEDEESAQDLEKSEAEEKKDESDEDDEAAKLAAEMMADQGLGPATEETEKENDVKAQSTAPEKEIDKPRAPFERVIPGQDKITKGFVLLSDIQMDQIMVFAKGTFIHGQNIIVKFLVPNSFSQLIEVMASTNISRNSKIISESKPDYRIQCQFQFKFPNERKILRDFLQSVEPEIPDPPKKLKRPDSDDDDEDFDDLGF